MVETMKAASVEPFEGPLEVAFVFAVSSLSGLSSAMLAYAMQAVILEGRTTEREMGGSLIAPNFRAQISDLKFAI